MELLSDQLITRYSNGEWSRPNRDTLYTPLLREMAKHVKYYLSDILYIVKEIEKAIERKTQSEIIIGMRECGVDIIQDKGNGYIYNAFYVVHIVKETEEKIRITVGKI